MRVRVRKGESERVRKREREWVLPKPQYRIVRNVVRMLDAKLVFLQ